MAIATGTKTDIAVNRPSTVAGDVHQLVFIKVERDIARRVTQGLSSLHKISSISNTNLSLEKSRSIFEKSDGVLVGPNVKDPVNIAQLIHSSNKRVPIIILCNAARCATLRQDLMFSPFVGHEIIVWSTSDIDGVAEVLADAAERRSQRQRYQEAAMANAHVQLEVLPLLRPETAEYVGGLFDYEPIGVVAVTPDAKIITINRHARQLLDTSEQDIHGTSLLNHFPEDERGRLENLLALAIKTNGRLAPELFEFPAAKDKLSFIEVTTSAFSNPVGRHGAMVVLQEVTLRVQSERQRTEAVVELRMIANALRTMHAISTGNSSCLSEKITELLRLGCEQFGLPIGLFSKVEDDTLTVLESVAENTSYAVGAESKLEFNYCAATICSVEPIAIELASGTSWRNHPAYRRNSWEAYLGTRIIVDGKVFGTLCFMSRAPHRSHFSTADREILKLMSRWISGELQRERAEAHMRKISSAVEQTADSVIITDCDGTVEYVNPSFGILTGYARDEVLGMKANFLAADEKINSDLWDAVKRGADFRFLFNGQTKDGKPYHEQMTITPLKNETGVMTNLIATGQDVTALIAAKEHDRKRQAELTHVARLSTLGGMVSGLAHELNQPLCAITTYAQTCLRKMRSGEAQLEDLEHGLVQIVRQAERADEIFSRIRNFSRKSQMRRQRANIREIIETTIGFIQTELNHNNIKLELSFPRTEPIVFADAIQIQQVLLNLVRNSLDAMANNGDREKRITVKVTTSDRNFTKIVVTDTGPGCPPEELHRLFEPFFTTKDAGLGVGLSISQAIVEGHGGKLWLSSSSSKGSVFCLTLPTWNKTQDATGPF